MLEVWHSLPPEFRLPRPEARVTLWRGDKIGKIATGMCCRLSAEYSPDQVVFDIAQRGYDALTHLVDQHTSAHPDSPLVSTTSNLRMAQLFANSGDRSETIYEINVPAHRILRDPESIGAPQWPKDSELFVIGDILPSDVSRIKTNNDDQIASELIYEHDGRFYIADGLSDVGALPIPTSPNPRGKWKKVKR
jgi:hypothetical protein